MSDFPKTSAPAQRAIASAGLKQLEDLAKITEKDFKALHGIGPSTLKILKPLMREKKITFKQY